MKRNFFIAKRQGYAEWFPVPAGHGNRGSVVDAATINDTVGTSKQKPEELRHYARNTVQRLGIGGLLNPGVWRIEWYCGTKLILKQRTTVRPVVPRVLLFEVGRYSGEPIELNYHNTVWAEDPKRLVYFHYCPFHQHSFTGEQDTDQRALQHLSGKLRDGQVLPTRNLRVWIQPEFTGWRPEHLDELQLLHDGTVGDIEPIGPSKLLLPLTPNLSVKEGQEPPPVKTRTVTPETIKKAERYLLTLKDRIRYAKTLQRQAEALEKWIDTAHKDPAQAGVIILENADKEVWAKMERFAHKELVTSESCRFQPTEFSEVEQRKSK